MMSGAHGKFSAQRLVVIGCGYIGTAAALVARERGMPVTALTRNVAHAEALRAAGMTVVVADAASREWHREIAFQPTFVLNCLSGGGGGLEDYERSYLGGMESVVQWATGVGGVGTLVYTGSTSVYPHDGGVTVSETKAGTGGEGDVLARLNDRRGVLLRTEATLAEARAACNRWFILRLAGIYGPGRHHVLDQVRSGKVAGKGGHRLNLAHRDDIVAAIWACFDASAAVRSDVFNVADDGPAPKAEVVAWLAARLGVPVPAFTGEPAAGRRAVTPDRVIANDRLKAALGWEPKFRTFRDGYASLLGSSAPGL